MLSIQNITYTHPNKNLLFDKINLTVNQQEKIAIIGNNGSGKSTLFRLISKNLLPSDGQLSVQAEPYYVPQIFDQYNHLTIAQALKIENKLRALQEILKGKVTDENYALLNDDWTIEERCTEALSYWQLSNLHLSQKMGKLSGGQKTKVFLAGLSIYKPALVLLDEPTNYLDIEGRHLLYCYIQSSKSTLIIVSHDRKLLNLVDKVAELSKKGISLYGGNFTFYTAQKQIENHAINHDLRSKEKALRKSKEKERETLQRKQKLDSRGKSKQEKAGVAKIMMNTLRNNAENSSSKIKSIHAEKIEDIKEELQELRSVLPDIDKMKFGFDHSSLHKGKILVNGQSINFSYNDLPLWRDNLTFHIKSGERIALEGSNGSGKSTLIKIILGEMNPKYGEIYRADNSIVYIDQEYSLIDNELGVYEQAQQFNISGLLEHEVKIRLNRFLFTKDFWEKACHDLSGGEKMKLVLCCLTIRNQSPVMIILDEPGNNLDIQNLEIISTAQNEYQGTLIVVSHDEAFLKQIKIDSTIHLQ